MVNERISLFFGFELLAVELFDPAPVNSSGTSHLFRLQEPIIVGYEAVDEEAVRSLGGILHRVGQHG